MMKPGLKEPILAFYLRYFLCKAWRYKVFRFFFK